jgi:hypothetical protein
LSCAALNRVERRGSLVDREMKLCVTLHRAWRAAAIAATRGRNSTSLIANRPAACQIARPQMSEPIRIRDQGLRLLCCAIV